MTSQELMDIEGAGNAEKALKKSGDWDEYAGMPDCRHITDTPPPKTLTEETTK